MIFNIPINSNIIMISKKKYFLGVAIFSALITTNFLELIFWNFLIKIIHIYAQNKKKIIYSYQKMAQKTEIILSFVYSIIKFVNYAKSANN